MLILVDKIEHVELKLKESGNINSDVMQIQTKIDVSSEPKSMVLKGLAGFHVDGAVGCELLGVNKQIDAQNIIARGDVKADHDLVANNDIWSNHDINSGNDVNVKGNVNVKRDVSCEQSISVKGDVILTNADCAEEFDVLFRSE